MILIVPAVEKGLGGGHLSRSLFLFEKLKQQGREVYLWIAESQKDDILNRISENGFSSHTFTANEILSQANELSQRTWDFIVLDRFRTPPGEFAFFAAFAPIIGIDEGGSCRDKFDFLIDLLPALPGSLPNLSAPWLLPMPKNRRPAGEEKPGHLGSILISFGAEDSAGLGLAVARFLAAQKTDDVEITLITPNHEMINEAELPGIKIIGTLPNLKEHLAEYTLFITHFGLGAFEAVYARVPVLLVSPTAYHEKLAKNAGFLTMPRKKITRLGVSNIKEISRRFGLEDDQKEDITSFIGGLSPRLSRKCPLCFPDQTSGNTDKQPDKVIGRFPEESYRRCSRCKLIYLSRLKPCLTEYEQDYFFDFYKKQYGKTYLEDFPNLKEIARRRLAIISNLLSRRHGEGRLLDIGCAYGPFLAAAAEAGFSPSGIEPAEDAVRHVKREFGFQVWHGLFPDVLPEEYRSQTKDNAGFFDAVTLWYVIEHFEEPGKILRETNKLLKKGGVLAFSTPSATGISGRKCLRSFLKSSPPDHFNIWSPGSCRRILKQYGFRLCKIAVTGHHPERFPLFGRFVNPKKKSLFYRLLFFVSRLFHLGDTFEVYGVKES